MRQIDCPEKNGAAHHRRHRDEDRHPGQQHRDPDAAEADLTEPQPIDVGVHQARPDEQDCNVAHRCQQLQAGASGQRREFVGERVPICMLRDSKNPVPTGRYGRDGDAVW